MCARHVHSSNNAQLYHEVIQPAQCKQPWINGVEFPCGGFIEILHTPSMGECLSGALPLYEVSYL